MNWIRQTIAVLLLNLRTVPARLGSSAVAIIGIAGVVIVFVSVLSISAGFSAAMRGSGSPDRAIIMRSGTDSEMMSAIEGPEVRIIKEAPGVRRDGQTALGTADLYVIIELPKKSSPDTRANVPMRGIEPAGMKVRDEVSLVEGRMFRFGSNEVIVGKGTHNLFLGLNVAPTEEMILISFKMSLWHAIAAILASILLMHGFVYALSFIGGHELDENTPGWHALIRFTTPGYVIAFAISLYCLWTFHRLDGLDPTQAIVATAVLAFPSAIGAAAARLIL